MNGTADRSTAPAALVVFENCGHFFDEHLDELRAVVSDWVVKKMTGIAEN